MSRPDRRRWLPLIALVCALGGWRVAPALAEDEVREVCEIPGHGGIGLVVPRAWRAKCLPLAKPASASMAIGPSAGPTFELRVTAVWLQPEQRKGLDDEARRRSLQDVAAPLLARAVEKQAVLEEFRGPEASGCAFTLTDKAPGPGEFLSLTQGAFALGEIEVGFTLLSTDPRSEDAVRALRVLREARFVVKQ